MAVEPPDPIASGYDTFYAAWGRSPTLRRIWRDEVTGDDFPEEFAHISFMSLPALRSLTEGLRLAPGQTLVDLACGAGGPGLWAAVETEAVLVGIDRSAVGVARAQERAGTLGIESASFRQGTFEATGLDAAVADAVMTVDALQYAPDKTKALREMARILRPEGRLSFLAFELDPAKVEGLGLWADPISDYRPLLDDTGFDLVSYEQVPGWQENVRAGFGAVLEQREQLAVELGDPAAAALAAEATITLQLEPYCGHVLAKAIRSR